MLAAWERKNYVCITKKKLMTNLLYHEEHGILERYMKWR